jgi:ATP-dependent protease ClpP protease subunit
MLDAARHRAMLDFMERKPERFVNALSPAEKLYDKLDKRGLVRDREKSLEVIESFLCGEASEENPGYWFNDYCNPPDLFIKDYIRFNSAKAIVERMASISRLGTLYVNSAGGSVEQALQICDALRGKVQLAVVHNIAASAAVSLILVADKILIDRNAKIVLHPAIACVTGNATAHMGIAVALDVETDTTIEALVKRTGQPVDTVRGWMNSDRDTVFSADEAVAVGLADGFFETPTFEVVP